MVTNDLEKMELAKPHVDRTKMERRWWFNIVEHNTNVRQTMVYHVEPLFFDKHIYTIC